MKVQNKLKIIIAIILSLISICSIVFGRYSLETEKKEVTNINIKTCEFNIWKRRFIYRWKKRI